MRRFAGCCRFIWNKALALEKENYEQGGKRHGYNNLAGLLRDWEKAEDTAFLAEAHSQILQQSLKDLDRAYVNFFQKRAGYPRFKKEVNRILFVTRKDSSWMNLIVVSFCLK